MYTMSNEEKTRQEMYAAAMEAVSMTATPIPYADIIDTVGKIYSDLIKKHGSTGFSLEAWKDTLDGVEHTRIACGGTIHDAGRASAPSYNARGKKMMMITRL